MVKSFHEPDRFLPRQSSPFPYFDALKLSDVATGADNDAAQQDHSYHCEQDKQGKVTHLSFAVAYERGSLTVGRVILLIASGLGAIVGCVC